MLTRANLNTLVTLYRCEPATAELAGITCNQETATTAGRLVELVRLGFATRRKFDPLERAPLTEDERQARRDGWPTWRRRTGKRPYLYELTPSARHAAQHLARAFDLLETEENDNENRARKRA